MAKTDELTLNIGGLRCASCVSSVEKNLSGSGGVRSVRVNLATRSASISYDREETDVDRIIKQIEQLGFTATVGRPDFLEKNDHETKTALRQFKLSLLLTLPLALVAMWPMVTGRTLIVPPFDGLAQAVLAALVLILGGRPIISDAIRQTVHFRANMNSLIGVGTLTAFGWSLYLLASNWTVGSTPAYYFESVGMIITLILLGRYLEARARGKAGEAIRALVGLRPSKALAVINGVEIEIDAATVRPGMTLQVRPGERLAADGIITEGRPIIDESMLTGESIPVEKNPSDKVVGGSINGNRSFRFEVTASGEDTFLAGMIRLVAEAQGRKAPVQKLADHVAARFVPAVLITALLTLIIWYWYAPDSPLLIQSVISVLIIACPCALGLATPTAILAGTGRAAREGIIIRGGDILERITKLNAIVFDKTGTLTCGEFEVISVYPLESWSRRELIRMAGSAEKQNSHPLARAIVEYMESEQIEPHEVRKLQVLPGFGLEAEYRSERLLIGNEALLKEERIDTAPAQMTADREMRQGQTVVFIAYAGRLAGLISLGDRLRADAAAVITGLNRDFDRVSILSGDNYRTVAGVARSIGLEFFEAEVRPERKQEVIESYKKSGSCLAMVGDGINDAPALAAADVGVAIGGGTDVAVETADVVLIRSELTDLLKMFKIAKNSMRIIKQNLFWAFFYNVLAIPVAAGLFYPVFGWTLSPMIAAGAMALSSVFVVSNSLRLSRLPLN